MKAYDVPKTASAPHGFKYSLVYIRGGNRLVGYDNHEARATIDITDPTQRRTALLPLIG